MDGSLYQIVLTVWLGVHPVTYTLPKIYPVDICRATANSLFTRIKPGKAGVRMEIECVATDKQDS